MPVPGSNVNEHIVVDDPGKSHERGNANAQAAHPDRGWHGRGHSPESHRPR